MDIGLWRTGRGRHCIFIPKRYQGSSGGRKSFYGLAVRFQGYVIISSNSIAGAWYAEVVTRGVVLADLAVNDYTWDVGIAP